MEQDKDKARANELYQQMSLKEKIGYIIQYHWIKIVIAVIAVVIVVSVIGRFTWNREKERCLGVGLYSGSLNITETETLGSKLNETYAFMTENGKKEFKTYPFYLDSTDGTSRMNLMYKLVASVELKEMDVMLGDRETLEGEANKEYFMDLREIFTEEELQKIDEAASKGDSDEEHGVIYVTYAIYSDNGRVERYVENVPLLICVEGMDADLDNMIVSSPAYLAVMVNAVEIENTRTFIFTLLGIE